jgi:hypothetical protein
MTLNASHNIGDGGHATDHNAIAAQVNQNTTDIAARITTAAANAAYAPITGSSAYRPVTVATGLDYTGATDQTSALQAILNAASAAAAAVSTYTAATVITMPGVLKLTGLTLPAQVNWEAENTKIVAGGSGAVITTAGDRWRLAGPTFAGGGAGVGANGIVVASGCHYGIIEQVSFDQFSGRALLLASGSMACTVRDLFAQNCLLTTAGLAAKTGVLEIAGTDHHIYGNVEVTASRSSLSSGSAFAGAVVVSGSANFLEHTLAEISDFGFNVSGADNTLTGCRADLNRGHGFELSGGGCTYTGCIALRNGRETDNTYDGFNVTAGVSVFSGCLADSSSGGGFTHRYGFNDTQNSDASKNLYVGVRSLGHSTKAFNNAAFGAAFGIGNHPRAGLPTGATPSVDQITNAYCQNGGATTITNFLNGVGGQQLTIYGDGNTTIQHNGSPIVLKGGVNATPAGGQSLTLLLSNGTWFEIARAF